MADQPFKLIISSHVLKAVGNRGVEMIVDRTSRGLDMHGRPFADYSRKPFFRPAKGIQKYALQAMINEGRVKFFIRSRAGWFGPVDISKKSVRSRSWGDSVDRYYVVIEGGYAYFKRVIYRQTSYSGTVNLMLSGRMLGSVGVIAHSSGDNSVTIGFTRLEEARKASFHQVTGAGRSKVKRQFMGFTPDELSQLTQMVRELIKPELDRLDTALSGQFTVKV